MEEQDQHGPEGQQPREEPAPQSPPAQEAETVPAVEPDKDARLFAMLAHLLGLVLGFLGPLIIWLVKREDSPFVEDQGKEALNFQLTILIGYAIAGVTAALLIGFLLGPAIWVVNLVFVIMAAMKSNKGEAYRYPVCIRFIK